MHPLIASLALASFSPPALFLPDVRPDPWVLPYPATGVSGQATEVLVGRFSDDTVSDGVLLVGGNLHLLYAPERFSSYSKLSGPFTSMTKVTLNANPLHEGLLASTSTGLVLVSWDPMARQLAASSVPGSSSWASARQLQTVGSGAGSKVCGLSSSGTSALYGTWNGSVLGSMGSLSLGHTALTLAGLNWDGDPLLDFVFDDGTGLWKKLGTGTPAARIGSANCTQPLVLRLPHVGSTDADYDSVVWLTQNSAGPGQVMYVVHGPADSFEDPIYGGSITSAHLTLADVDADGAQDLVVTQSNDHTCFVLFRQHGGTMSFGFFSEHTHAALGFDLGAVSGSYPGSPAVGAGDLDGDGDEDLLYAGQPGIANLAQVCFATGITEEEGVGAVSEEVLHVKPWIISADYDDWVVPITDGDDSVDAQLTLSQWGAVVDPAVASATHVRVTVWGRMTATGEISPVALQDWIEDSSDPDITVPIPLPPGTDSGLPQYLVFQVSYVECDGTPEADHVVRTFPSWTGQIDRHHGIDTPTNAGGGTTGGIDRPPPPPSGTPPSP